MSSLVNMEWLNNHLNDETIRIVDCRYELGDSTAGKQSYLQEHIPGALFFDVSKDLSRPVEKHGGRHPLPNIDELVRKLGKAGIDETIKVIAYDDQGGAMASRFWWLLTYLGHPNVSILNGGFTQWKSQGYPVTDEIPSVKPRIFNPTIQADILVDMSYVKNRLDDEGITIIDSREESRYLGGEEPIDPVSGHIPGALNYFWKNNLGESGYWNTQADLEKGWEERLKGIDPDSEIIVYCGSGITACPNFLALKESRYNNVKLYAGSWSDWISYPDNPIAKGKE